MRARNEKRERLRAVSSVGVFGPYFFFFFPFFTIVLSVLSLTPRVGLATFNIRACSQRDAILTRIIIFFFQSENTRNPESMIAECAS